MATKADSRQSESEPYVAATPCESNGIHVFDLDEITPAQWKAVEELNSRAVAEKGHAVAQAFLRATKN